MGTGPARPSGRAAIACGAWLNTLGGLAALAMGAAAVALLVTLLVSLVR